MIFWLLLCQIGAKWRPRSTGEKVINLYFEPLREILWIDQAKKCTKNLFLIRVSLRLPARLLTGSGEDGYSVDRYFYLGAKKKRKSSRSD